jgi:hypothetical protein
VKSKNERRRREKGEERRRREGKNVVSRLFTCSGTSHRNGPVNDVNDCFEKATIM